MVMGTINNGKRNKRDAISQDKRCNESESVWLLALTVDTPALVGLYLMAKVTH